MTQTKHSRSNMLGSIYQILPEIDSDYAAKLVYESEKKKTLTNLKKDMQYLFSHFEQSHVVADNIVAKLLLDEISLPAAIRQLHIKSNALTIFELAKALSLPEEDKYLLLNFYAAAGAEYFFDEEFARLLKEIPNEKNLSDTDKSLRVINQLLTKAKQTEQEQKDRPAQNKQAIYKLADTYRLSYTLTAALLRAYAVAGAMDFASSFEQVFSSLQSVHDQEKLNASLTAKTLLNQLTQKDAQDITLASKLLKGKILEDDLVTIACRYLKLKTPQDIAETFYAVLKRLPHAKQKEENLALAVRILLDGTEHTFEMAQQAAALQRDRTLLYNTLSKRELFSGYEQDLASQFASHKTANQLIKQAQEILRSLPFVTDPAENSSLACQVLLGRLSQQEALEQAQQNYTENFHAFIGQAANSVLDSRNSKKSPTSYVAFFEKSLTPYHFWKSNPDALEFSLQILAEQVEGQSESYFSHFVLEMLENGASLELTHDLLTNIRENDASSDEVSALLSSYKQARTTEQPK